jgi:tRNA(Ile)-lysidine synthase
VEPAQVRQRIEEHVRRHELIPAGGAVTCLVSGGADSTCLWHALRELGYEVSALHVNHRLRGAESDRDARFCREFMGADVVAAPPAATEAELREIRYTYARDRLRATGHTASDQVETILYRLAASGTVRGIKARREDGVVRPLLPLWRDETHEYCRLEGLPFRTDSSNAATKRGLIRDEILPRLRQLHPAADTNLLALTEERPHLPRQLEEALLSLLASREGSKRIDLGSGLQAVREYDSVWVESGPVSLSGNVRWGSWTIESDLPGLHVRAWRAGDRLAGRNKKVQDVFVDAKVPRSEREAWPLVVRGDEVIAIPGLVDAAGVRARRDGEA